MPRKHRDNSTRLNLERNLRQGKNEALSDYSLWKRDNERLGNGRNGRPFVDKALERETDKVAMIHARKGESYARKENNQKGPESEE